MLIETRKLSKIYFNDKIATLALKNINLKIQAGEFITIMGPSGSGKSTLMQILGLLDRSTEGEYFFEGQNVAKLSDNFLAFLRNQRIGFVFQSFNLLPKLSVFENVRLPLFYNHKIDNWKHKKKVTNALKQVKLEHRINFFPNQLSGGEKQRVAIARALINNPAVIFADEPTGNLDSKSGLGIIKIFQDLNEQGKTIVLVTHESSTAAYAKRIILIKDGQIEKDFPVLNPKVAKLEDYLAK